MYLASHIAKLLYEVMELCIKPDVLQVSYNAIQAGCFSVTALGKDKNLGMDSGGIDISK